MEMSACFAPFLALRYSSTMPMSLSPQLVKPIVTINQPVVSTINASEAAATVMDVDFSSGDGSELRWMQYAVWSASDMQSGTGTELLSWTNIAEPIASDTYTQNWTIDFSIFRQGPKYISIRAINSNNALTTATDALLINIVDDRSPAIESITPPDGTTIRRLVDNFVSLKFTTDESASCRWSLSHTAYQQMENTCKTTGRMSHRCDVSAENGTSQTVHFACVDDVGNETTVSNSYSFAFPNATQISPAPTSPLVAVEYFPPAMIVNGYVHGNNVYMISRTSMIKYGIDDTALNMPMSIYRFPYACYFDPLIHKATVSCAAGNGNDMTMFIDLSNPDAPSAKLYPRSTLELSYRYDIMKNNIVVDGSYYDVTDAETPVLNNIIPSSPYGLSIAYIQSDIFYLLNETHDIERYDISNPDDPVRIDTLASRINAIAGYGDFLYLITDTGRLQTYDISDPSAPVMVSDILVRDTNLFYDIRMSGKYLLVKGSCSTTGTCVFGIVDIGNPSAPLLVDTGSLNNDHVIAFTAITDNVFLLFTKNRILRVTVSGNELTYRTISAWYNDYQNKISDANDSLMLMNISSVMYAFDLTKKGVEAPVAIGTGIVYDGAVGDNGIVFLLRSNGFVEIWDYSNFTSPVSIANLYLSGKLQEGSDATYSNGFLYVTTSGGSFIVNVANVHSPFVSSFIPVNGRQIAVDGNRAYILQSDTSALPVISIIDITNPTRPYETGTFVPFSPISRFAMFGKYIFTVENNTELNMYDSTLGTLISTYHAAGNINSIDIMGRHIGIGVEGQGADLLAVGQGPSLSRNYSLYQNDKVHKIRFDDSGDTVAVYQLFDGIIKYAYPLFEHQAPRIVSNMPDRIFADTSPVIDIDFEDIGAAKLSSVQYALISSPCGENSTGTTLIPWTTLESNIDAQEFRNEWTVDYDTLAPGQNYLSVKATDNDLNSTIARDMLIITKITSDIIPPPVLAVNDGPSDDVQILTETTGVSANWSYATNSAVMYVYSIGTNPGATDVVDWTPATTTGFVNHALALDESLTHYVSVKTVNSLSIYSDTVTSNGFRYDATAPSVMFKNIDNSTLLQLPSHTITALAADTNMAKWEMSISYGASETAWVTIASATASNQDISVTIDTSRLSDDIHARLTATDIAGHTSETIATLTLVDNINFSSSAIAGKWQLVSVPVIPADNIPSAMYGITGTTGDIRKRLPLSGISGQPQEYFAPSTVHLGDGFWIKASTSTTQFSYAGIMTSATKHTVQLSQGWNQFGVPFNFDYPWFAVRILWNDKTYDVKSASALGLIENAPYTYDAVSESWKIVKDEGTLIPGKGYELMAYQPVELVFDNAGTNLLQIGRTVAVEVDMDLKLSLSTSKGNDTDNHLIIVPHTSTNTDHMDLPEPPDAMVPDVARLYLTHNESEDSNRLSIVAVSSPANAATSTVAYLTVSSIAPESPATITWDTNDIPSSRYTLILTDTANGNSIVMNTTGSYSFFSSGERLFSITINRTSVDTAVTKEYVLGPGWHIISFPVTLSSINSISGDPTTPSIFQFYNGELLPPSETDIQNGYGYWAYSQATSTITIKGNITAGVRSIMLSPGWNLIGNPYEKSIKINDMVTVQCASAPELPIATLIDSGIVSGSMFTYSGDNYFLITPTEYIHPWSAAFLKVNAQCILKYREPDQ